MFYVTTVVLHSILCAACSTNLQQCKMDSSNEHSDTGHEISARIEQTTDSSQQEVYNEVQGLLDMNTYVEGTRLLLTAPELGDAESVPIGGLNQEAGPSMDHGQDQEGSTGEGTAL